MAAVECAVYNLLGVFHKYSSKEGDALKLNKPELSTLLLQELPFCYRDDAIIHLDLDGDGEVDFLEFIEFITEITTELQKMYIRSVLRDNKIPRFDAQSPAEKAIVVLIKVFYKYAGKGGNPLCLERHELRQLLRKEMPTLNSCLEGNSNLTQILTNLEENGKAEIDFREFMEFVGNFAVAVDFTFIKLSCDDEN
ncbi:uncharacterized protein LOC144783321 [Lissotriton helveticus]